MEEKVWLKVADEVGERYCMILSEDIRAKTYANSSSWGEAVFSLLSKIQMAAQASEHSISITCIEAETLLQCLNSYFEDFSCSPFDEKRPLGSYRWAGDKTLKYPVNLITRKAVLS